MDVKTIVSIAIMFVGIIIILANNRTSKTVINTKFIVRSGVFSAIAIILYLVPVLNISLPIFPEFLKIHVDEIPAFIAGFAYGPLSAIFVIVVKTIAKLPMVTNPGELLGVFIDLLYSMVFVLPAALIYKKVRNAKGVVKGLIVSTILQIIVSCFVTTFVMLNFYLFVMGWPKQAILDMCQKINPAITSLDFPFLFMVALPFNAMKDAIVLALTLILYKRMHRLIDKIKA